MNRFRGDIIDFSAKTLLVDSVLMLQRQRELREKDEWDRFRADNPLIKEQFADLKAQLAAVSEDEWKGIPEIGDYTIKKQKRFEVFSATSDSLLASALATNRAETRDQSGGSATPAGFSTDLTALGKGRKQMLGVNLDRCAALLFADR